MSFCLYHGIMELWNDGIVGFERTLFILNFIIKMNFLIYPILQYSKTHYSAKASPRAQCSSIPIGVKPLTCVIPSGLAA